MLAQGNPKNSTLQEQFLNFLSLKSNYENMNNNNINQYMDQNKSSTQTMGTNAHTMDASTHIENRMFKILIDIKFKMDQLNLFSLNESLVDLNWNEMKYLSIYCYLGIYIQLIKSTIEREMILLKAKEYFITFLEMMDVYELLSSEDSKWMKNVLNGIKPKGEAIRATKIAQYKREKACKEKEENLQQLLLGCSENDDTQELEKDLVLTTLEILVQTAINSLKDIGDELEMIEFGKKMKLTANPTPSSTKLPSESTLEPRLPTGSTVYSGPMLSKEGKPLRPFVITSEHNKRQQILNGVFQPGHSLPTMTIEEYLDREMARGNFLSGGTEPPKKNEIDDLDFNAQDAETYKQRDWDEFKDHNPAGWGNRYNKG